MNEQRDDLEILSFSFTVVRNETTGYVLAVQFPTELRNKVLGMKDDFFGSFKIVRH